MSERRKRVIHTPDQRARVFVSSTLQEQADEHDATTSVGLLIGRARVYLPVVLKY